MKSVDCDVIQDLLQNYVDNLSSDTTNKLIEKHLETCQVCNNVLNDMRQEVNKEPEFNQDKQVDYLKGFNRKKKINVIASIIITVLILIICGMSVLIFLRYNEFYVNIDDIFIESVQPKIEDSNNKKNTFMFNIYDYDLKNEYKCYKYEVVENTGIKTIHIKTVGKYPFYGGSVLWYYVEIDETIDKIYLEDKKGNLREIWDKEKGLQMRPRMKIYK